MNSSDYISDAAATRSTFMPIFMPTFWAMVLPLMLLLGACSTTPRITPQTTSPREPTSASVETHHTREPIVDAAENSRTETPSSLNSDTITSASDIEQALGEEAALRAIALVGKPYRYGGVDLKGFDCSGLVFYIYKELGIEAPRSALEQHQRALPVTREELLPGDLVFFQINRRRISHVGIYIGDNRFVHAPQTGKYIELRNLDEPYYAKHWIDAGRLQRE